MIKFSFVFVIAQKEPKSIAIHSEKCFKKVKDFYFQLFVKSPSGRK